MFIEMKGRLINCDHVEWFEMRPTPVVDSESHTLVAHLRSGEVVAETRFGKPLNEADLAVSYIAAQPGFQVLQFWKDDDEEGVSSYPIIAWKMLDIWPDPVILGTLPDEYAILQPDGRVLMVEEAEFDTIEAWQKEMSERARKDARGA